MRKSLNITIYLMISIILLSIHGNSTHAQESIPSLSWDELRNLKFETAVNAGGVCDGGFTQDQDGFLWMACQNTLLRFDGIDSKDFTNGSPSISDRFTTTILEDSEGLIWVGTKANGLNKYDKNNNTITYYQHDPDNPHSISSNLFSPLGSQAIFEDSDGFLWIGLDGGGLNKFDKETEQFIHYRHDPNNPNSLSHDKVLTIIEDKEGLLWIGTDGGALNKFDKINETFTHYNPDPSNPSATRILSLIEDKKGHIWVGTDGAGLLEFNQETEIFTAYQHDPNDTNSLGDNAVATILEDSSGFLWIGHNLANQYGLSIFDKENNIFIRYAANPEDPFSISSNSIMNIYEDNDTGIIWLMNLTGQLDKYDPQTLKLQTHQHDPKNPHSISDSAVIPMIEDREGIIWLGTGFGGLNKYDRQTEQFTAYFPDPNNPTAIKTALIAAILEDSSGTLWLGNAEASISIFDRESGQVTKTYAHDPNDPDSLGNTSMISSIIEDKDNPNHLWLGTWNAEFFGRFNKETEKFTAYPDIANISMMMDDDQGNIWLATQGDGLIIFNKADENQLTFQHDPQDANSISSNIVMDIFEDSNGRFWIATKQGGLDEFDSESQTFKHYTEEDGFSANEAANIVEDDAGYLWFSGISSDLGAIIKFDPEIGEIDGFSQDEGAQQTYFRESRLKTNDGEIWFGGLNGVNHFYPNQVESNPNIPPIVLTSFKQGGEAVDLEQATEKVNDIHLDWQNNFFEFEYAALNYTRPEQNQYAYMLEGVDEAWYQAGHTRFGRYTNLTPGVYTLRIKGSNNDGLWNEEGIAIRVTITPPWWQTWWFQGSLGVLLVTLFVGGVFLRFRSVENQRQQLEQQVAEQTDELRLSKEEAEVAREKAEVASQAKSQFLSNMSHELRTPLNGILGYAQILERDKNLTAVQADGLNIIRQSGVHLLTLINDILDLSKIEAGKMDLHPSDIHLPSFLQNIVGIIRMRAEEKSIHFSYEALSPLPTSIRADEKRLRQILLNLLGNAVKFTDKGYATLNISALSPHQAAVETSQKDSSIIENNEEQMVHLRFSVADTGVGMTAKQLDAIFLPFEQVGDVKRRDEGTGLGLTISRQLVEAMGSQLFVKSTPSNGSTFWFDLTCPIVALDAEIATEPRKNIVGYKGDRLKILIVDDKDYNRLVLVNLLEPLGFHTYTAKDGQEEIEKARQLQPDLILTDIVMPKMTGLEAAQKIRQIPILQNTPIIAVSASVLSEDQKQSKIAGCNDFLVKPVNAENLFAMLEKYLTLQWLYDEDPSVTKIDTDTPEMIPPPPNELAILLNLCKQGNMQVIRQQAKQIAQMGDEYQPFADTLLQLAQAYEVKKVQDLVEYYAGVES